MRVKNRLSPYPILSEFSDDYVKGTFESEITVDMDAGQLRVKVDFKLDSEYLKNLIDEGLAEFVTHIECPRTSFRRILANRFLLHTASIPIENLTDAVEITTFIITSEDIEHSSGEFNPDYDGFAFNLKKNEILAIGDALKVSITNDTKDLESLPSLIRIVKVDDTQNAIAVDTDGDLIKVKLAGKVCEDYKTVGNSVFSKTAFSLIMFPALMTVLSRMVNADADLSERRWYQVLSKQMERKKIDLNSLAYDDGSILDACQKLFNNPIARAFDELIAKSGVTYED